jgi:hypothetical protein
MPIPSQNDFLLPFLQTLSDGNSHTRSQLMFGLAKHFDISEEEAQAMSGNQFTLVSRLSWCDAHFVKAGFAAKTQHPQDSMADEFRITALGVRELHKNPAHITVGYLQSFYRGKVLRGAGSDDTTSDAELALYAAFENLSDAFTVFHSVRWFAKGKGTVGEADFVIAHPQHGVLILEVKGGLISMGPSGNDHQWYSTSQSGRVNKIQDPAEQAERSRRALSQWLEDDPRTGRFRYAIFPAVALPDSVVGRDVRPDAPADIFLDMRHLDNVEARLLEIFGYWKSHADASNQRMDGKPAVDALVELLVPTRKLQPRVADIFERERRKIDELTQNQFRILRQLRGHRRAAIVGGAGTGKTMLAMEKAGQLADGGYRVLFLCFNKHLAEWVGKNLKHDNIMVATFHGLVGHARNWTKLYDASKMGWEEFTQKAPDLLLDAASIMRSADSGLHDKFFDAIIVDEAQDFEDTWWYPVPDMLKDPQNGVFYVFFDNNQRLYSQISNIPIEGEPFYLDENCRNTQHIHASLTPYTRDETLCIGPEGRPVEVIAAADKSAAHRELQRLLHRLVNEDGIRSEDILLLTPASEKRSQWKNDEQLGNFILTWNMETEMELAIRVCTIYRYKGLESAVIILTELDQRREEISNQLIYVGLSRARHHVVVIGELPLTTKDSSAV